VAAKKAKRAPADKLRDNGAEVHVDEEEKNQAAEDIPEKDAQEDAGRTEMEAPEEDNEGGRSPDLKWYVVHTYSGQEGKVKTYLEKAAAEGAANDAIGRVLVPTEEVTEVRRGKRATVTRKFYPSYVLVEMVMNDDTWQTVSNAPGVTGFVGNRRNPQPLRDHEVERVLDQMEHKRGRPSHEVPFQVGDSVTVVDGPFADFSGVVDEINPERGRLKVMVTILGRPTPVELDILQVRAL
jgi:transcriptional antiterminator NusG